MVFLQSKFPSHEFEFRKKSEAINFVLETMFYIYPVHSHNLHIIFGRVYVAYLSITGKWKKNALGVGVFWAEWMCISIFTEERSFQVVLPSNYPCFFSSFVLGQTDVLWNYSLVSEVSRTLKQLEGEILTLAAGAELKVVQGVFSPWCHCSQLLWIYKSLGTINSSIFTHISMYRWSSHGEVLQRELKEGFLLAHM